MFAFQARIAGMDEDLELYIGDRYSIVTMIFFVPYVSTHPAPLDTICPCGTMALLTTTPNSTDYLPIPCKHRHPQARGCTLAVQPGYRLGCCNSRDGFHDRLDATPGMSYHPRHPRGRLFPRLRLSVELLVRPPLFLLFFIFSTLSCEKSVIDPRHFPPSPRYIRYEVQKRFSGFYLLALLASGGSNILAYGLSEMKGLGGLNGWQWIFAIEGAITVLLGIMGFLFIVDFPDKATRPNFITRRAFLTEPEAAIVMNRIQRDRGDAVVDKLTWPLILLHLRDWKIWEFSFLYFLNNIVTYSFGFFLPIILRNDMGYSVAMAQILSFPPYVLATIWMFTTAWVADHYRRRGIIIIFNCSVAVVGVAMMAWAGGSAARYAGVFLGVAGANSNVPSLLSYMHNNIVGQMKRSIASALLIGGGACGGIAASNIFRQQDAPEYLPAMCVVIATQVLTVLLVLKNFVVYSRKNRRAERGEIVLEGQVGFRQTL